MKDARVLIEFDDAACTRGTVTLVPSWVWRLFGRRPCTAHVQLVTAVGWRYTVDGDWVETELEKILNNRRRWHEQRSLPEARLVTEEHS